MITIRLRELLWEHNVSGVDLHKATGISQSKISEIIRGKRTNITLDTIERICLFLDCNIEDLVKISR
ncbi:helix-turn-helix transcriptional regulator [bacterium]|nr:helix-turn-helix transcriptional regulator [bacterium]